MFTIRKLILIAVCAFVASVGYAYDKTTIDGILYIDGIHYNFHEDGTAEVVCYSNYKLGVTIYSVVIPETLDYNGINYSITSIGNKAFATAKLGSNGDLKSIKIPNTIVSIGDSAFCDCCGLTSFEIPNSVVKIGSNVFQECSALKSINIPCSVTSIGKGIFTGCQNLYNISVDGGNKKYDSRDNCNAIIESESNTLIAGCSNTTIPNTVTSIGDAAFAGCVFYDVEIPNTVTSIGDAAFAGCVFYEDVEIPNTVTSIGDVAFAGCDLYYLEIPESVSSIGNEAFAYCLNLHSITVDGGNKKYDSRDNCNAIIESESNTLIAGCSNTTIPNTVTSIGDAVFAGCWFSSIEIPSSVTSLGDYCFAGCSSLSSIEIPSSVTSLGKWCFAGCSSLSSIEIPSSVTSLGDVCFYGCSSLSSIEIPSSVTSLGDDCFSYCSSLSSIEP